MIVELEFEEMIEATAPVVDRWSVVVVPGRVELLPNNRYSPRYAWMFSFEKRLKYRVENVLGKPLGNVERILFGVDGAFSEGLSNAFVHGHRRDPERPIRVRCCVGGGGLAFSISDTGDGFPVVEHLGSLRRGSARYHFAGNGLRVLMDSTTVQASYSNAGKTLNLLVLF